MAFGKCILFLCTLLKWVANYGQFILLNIAVWKFLIAIIISIFLEGPLQDHLQASVVIQFTSESVLYCVYQCIDTIVYISVCQWKFSLRAPPLRVNEWRIMYANNGDLFQEIFEYPITWCHRPPVFVSGNKIYIIFLLNFFRKSVKKRILNPKNFAILKRK